MHISSSFPAHGLQWYVAFALRKYHTNKTSCNVAPLIDIGPDRRSLFICLIFLIVLARENGDYTACLKVLAHENGDLHC